MKNLFSSKINVFLISLSLSLMILLGFSLINVISIERPIKVIDFSTMTQEEALAWARENQLTLDVVTAYDEELAVGTILSQTSPVGERLFAGSSLTVTVSSGPDPDKLITLVDFTGKDIGEVQTFIDLNKLTQASIAFEKSKTISSAYFIKQSVTKDSIKRSEPIVFTISSGEQSELTSVIVPDFSTYTKQQISSWAETSNVKVNFIEDFSTSAAAGSVYEQSLAANSSVYNGSSLTVKISLGAGVVLENLVGKTKTEIDAFINSKGLKVAYTSAYSSTITKDQASSMSPSATTRVADGSTVNVTLSLGKISVQNFTGKTQKELDAWIASVNKQGANLKSTSTSEYSDSVSFGNLISQTPSTGDINPGSTISVKVSKGGGITVKSFTSRNDTQTGLTVNVTEKYSTSASGTVLSQSIAAGTVVDSGSTITLTVSIGTISVSNKTGSSLSDLQAWVNSVNEKGASLSISSSESYSSSVARGNIISQSPSSGSVNPGSTITASVSKGAGIMVINFVGGSTLTQSGLTVNKTEQYSSSVSSGVVISQSISSGTIVDSGTSMSIVVSKGVDPSTVPASLNPLAPMVATSTTGYDYTVNYLTQYLTSAGFTNFSFVKGNYGISPGQVNSQSPSAGTYAKNTAITIEVQQ